MLWFGMHVIVLALLCGFILHFRLLGKKMLLITLIVVKLTTEIVLFNDS